MRTALYHGEIIGIGSAREINESWTTKRREVMIQQSRNKVTITFEDQKRGHYLERQFSQYNYKVGDKITVKATLIGSINPKTQKVTNRLFVNEIIEL